MKPSVIGSGTLYETRVAVAAPKSPPNTMRPMSARSRDIVNVAEPSCVLRGLKIESKPCSRFPDVS
jgi:hypothetical protein